MLRATGAIPARIVITPADNHGAKILTTGH